jgi:tetrahydromethanopterin S-methyltransferase subunit B
MSYVAGQVVLQDTAKILEELEEIKQLLDEIEESLLEMPSHWDQKIQDEGQSLTNAMNPVTIIGRIAGGEGTMKDLIILNFLLTTGIGAGDLIGGITNIFTKSPGDVFRLIEFKEGGETVNRFNVIEDRLANLKIEVDRQINLLKPTVKPF